MWTEQCTQALNQLLEVIFRRYELAIPQLGAPLTLYLSTDKEVGVAVFPQPVDEQERAVAFMSRYLRPAEKRGAPVE